MRNTKMPSALQRLIRLFREALQTLGAKADEDRLEALAVFVNATMSGPGRAYHDIEHVFEVAAGAEPVQTLAALFHDVVYLQADGSLPEREAVLLTDVVEQRADGIVLRPFAETRDRLRAMLQCLFAIEPENVRPTFGGLNEFLSALLATRQLQPLLPSMTLVRIAACIEATIPFRAPDSSGRTPPEALFRRLAIVNERFDLGMQSADREQAVRQAVEVANRDVAVFAAEDTGRFLASSWKLLPESNPLLRWEAGYTLAGYQQGVSKMARSTHRLDPTLVFPHFLGTPDETTWRRRTDAARRNIQLSAHYLDAKLLAISVLSALANLTGGDAPVALFMGDLPTADRRSQRLEDYLETADPPGRDLDPEVFRLLAEGRRYDDRFDLKHSPLAAHIYKRVGTRGVVRLVRYAEAPLDPTYARRLLQALPGGLLQEIVRACCKIAVTRKQKLIRLIQEIAKNQ